MTTPTPVPVPPTLGRIVIYKLSDMDVSVILDRRNQAARASGPVMGGDAVYPDQECAAIVVCADGRYPNLKVFLDGFDDYWAYNRAEGDGEGQWHWPERKVVYRPVGGSETEPLPGRLSVAAPEPNE